MKILVALLAILAVSCAPKHDIILATQRICDFERNKSNYNVTIINPTNDSVKVKYTVYRAVKTGKIIDPIEAIFKSSVIPLAPGEHIVMTPLKIETLWNKYILYTKLESTNGDDVRDKVYPCEKE